MQGDAPLVACPLASISESTVRRPARACSGARSTPRGSRSRNARRPTLPDVIEEFGVVDRIPTRACLFRRCPLLLPVGYACCMVGFRGESARSMPIYVAPPKAPTRGCQKICAHRLGIFGHAPTGRGTIFIFRNKFFILSRERLAGGPSDDQLFPPHNFNNGLVVPRHEFLLNSHSSYRLVQKVRRLTTKADSCQ